MTSDIFLLVLGLLLIVRGADRLVDGASAIARKLKISEFVIGLTIVGFGTSCPELVVSMTGAFGGNADISIGNVIGSNIFNTLLILGMTALVRPVGISTENRRRDIPVALLATFLMFFCGMNRSLLGVGASDSLSRAEGIVFLLIFLAYIVYSFKTDSKPAEHHAEAVETSFFKAAVLSLAGLAGLIIGGKWFVDSAVAIARNIGVSDKFIAITLLAGGTSLPELAACVAAAAKNKGQLALGNILGSNVFNILLILGASAVVTPLSFADIDIVDVVVLLLSIILVWLCSYTFRKNKIDRFEGVIFILSFIAYYVWLFIKL